MHLHHNTNIWTKVKYSLVSPLLLPPISKRSGPKPWARLLVFVWGRPIHHFQSPSSGHAFHEEEHLSFLWRGVPSVRREKQRKRLPWGGTNTSPLLLSFCLPHPSPAFKPFLCEVGPKKKHIWDSFTFAHTLFLRGEEKKLLTDWTLQKLADRASSV